MKGLFRLVHESSLLGGCPLGSGRVGEASVEWLPRVSLRGCWMIPGPIFFWASWQYSVTCQLLGRAAMWPAKSGFGAWPRAVRGPKGALPLWK